MKLTFLGHAGFRLDIGGQTLLIDPWLESNPVFPKDRRAEAIEGATHILLTHGHFDHTSGVAQIAKDTGATLLAMVELEGLMSYHKIPTIGFNYGGTVMAGEVAITMVKAAHSSSMMINDKLVYAGNPAGYMISHEGRTVYVSGDTDIMADMEWMGDLHKPEIGILCAGGHYTMDMVRAAYAAKRYFNFKTLIPCHYKTFPALKQSADTLKSALPGVNVLEPEVMSPITL